MGFSQSVKNLFTVSKDDTQKEVSSDSSDEFKHITQELYKRGAELAERNKALSLLGAIDEIILTSIMSKDKTAETSYFSTCCGSRFSDSKYIHLQQGP